MRKLVLATIAATSLVGAGALTLSPLAFAQTPGAQPVGAQPAGDPPPPAPPHPPGPMHGPMPGMMHGWGPHQWMAEHHGAWMHGRQGMDHRSHTWSLFDRPANLALSPADVTTIAEAILLRNGQHDWKVGDVTPNEDHTVSFAYTTAHGDVVARFTMDTRTGHLSRTD
ncbi:MAG: hypothetical protein ACREFJ_14395 [Acetobacteraceae bacterium]